MYQFPIGVMMESFRLPTLQAIEMAAKIGAQGIQMYATKGEHAPENMTAADRKELLRLETGQVPARDAAQRKHGKQIMHQTLQ